MLCGRNLGCLHHIVGQCATREDLQAAQGLGPPQFCSLHVILVCEILHLQFADMAEARFFQVEQKLWFPSSVWKLQRHTVAPL